MKQQYAGLIFDFYSDALREGLGPQVMDKVGEVKLIEPGDMDSLPDREFAFVSFTKTGSKRRYFPVSDDGNTRLSMHYLEKFAESLTARNRVVTAKVLFKAAMRHGVEPTEYVCNLTSMALPGEDSPDFQDFAIYEQEKYAMDWNVGYRQLQAYPIGNKAQVEQSNYKFAETYRHMPAVHRRKVAQELSVACKEHGVTLEYPVAKYSSETTSPLFLAHVETRKGLLLDNEAKDTLSKLALCSGSMDPDDLAKALWEFDKMSGLDEQYDRLIADPWASVFGFSKKAALEFRGQKVAANDLIGLADSGELTGMFDEEMVQEFRQDPEAVFDSLPVPTKEAQKTLL